MKKIFLILFAAIVLNITVNSQSTIYLYYEDKGFANISLNMKFNNEDAFLLKKNQKKKCNMKNEGKLIITFKESSLITGSFGQRSIIWADEIQLNLIKNSVHHIKIVRKGEDINFIVLTASQAKKESVSKRYKDTYIYEEE